VPWAGHAAAAHGTAAPHVNRLPGEPGRPLPPACHPAGHAVLHRSSETRHRSGASPSSAMAG